MVPQLNPKSPRKSIKQGLALYLIVISGISVGTSPLLLAQQRVGYVLEMQGKWTISGTSENLNLGQSIVGGTLLMNFSPVDGDRIVIANLQGEIVKTIRCKSGVCRECRESGACYDPVHPLPNKPESASTVTTAFNAVLELFANKPDRYSVHRVRGSVAAIAKNGVVRFDSSEIEASDFLDGQEKGSYEFQFIPLSGEGSGTRALKSNLNPFNWTPGQKASLAIEGIHAGLYEVRIAHGGETSSGWVLMCNPASYSSSDASFQAFKSQTDSWGASVSQATKQAYQRA